MQFRHSTGEDVAAVARLYMASAGHHVGLDPSFHRVPEYDAVMRYYTELGGQGDH